MHIADGVLSVPVWTGCLAVTAAITGITLKRMKTEDMPRVALMTSAFFIASLIHIPIGPTSVHLILNGLVGIILGPLAFVAILVGLILQAVLFKYGGITAIGANTVMMGLPAFAAYYLFRLRRLFKFPTSIGIFGALSGAAAVFFGAVILALLLLTTGSEFIGVAKLAVLAHLPVMVIEGLIAAFVVTFLEKVKPEMLRA
jgi:cobalt/nickel transport system permease protein